MKTLFFLLILANKLIGVAQIDSVFDNKIWVSYKLTKVSIQDSFAGYISTSAKLILLGETHEQPNNKEIEFGIIKNLYNNNNVREVIIEYPVYYERLIGKYFYNNEIAVLDYFKKGIPKEENFVAFLIKVKDFNSQHQNDPIFIRCVNTSIYFNSLKYSIIKFSDQLFLSNPKAEVLEDILRIPKRRILGNKNKKKIALRIFREFQKDTSIQNKLGISDSDYNYLRRLILLLEPFTDYSNPDSLREQVIAKSIVILAEHNSSNFFGQFGSAHVSKNYASEWLHKKNWTSFTTILNNTENPFKNNICSIPQFYRTSYFKGKGNKITESKIDKEYLNEYTSGKYMQYNDSNDWLIKVDSLNPAFNKISNLCDFIIIRN